MTTCRWLFLFDGSYWHSQTKWGTKLDPVYSKSKKSPILPSVQVYVIKHFLKIIVPIPCVQWLLFLIHLCFWQLFWTPCGHHVLTTNLCYTMDRTASPSCCTCLFNTLKLGHLLWQCGNFQWPYGLHSECTTVFCETSRYRIKMGWQTLYLHLANKATVKVT